MKHSVVILALLAALSCSKVQEDSLAPILMQAEVTKGFTATTASSLESFCVTAFNSSGGMLWKNVPFTRSDGKYSGGKYWPVGGSMSFYAISGSFSQHSGANGITVQLSSSSGDIVRAACQNVPNGTVAMLTFDHIMAALDAVCLSAESGCTVNVTGLTYKLSGSGIYNITTNEWESAEAPLGEPVSVPSPKLSNTGIGALCIPAIGNCMISVSYDCTRGNHVESYTRSATVTLPMGMKSTIYGVLGADTEEMPLTISIAPWEGTEPEEYEL